MCGNKGVMFICGIKYDIRWLVGRDVQNVIQVAVVHRLNPPTVMKTIQLGKIVIGSIL